MKWLLQLLKRNRKIPHASTRLKLCTDHDYLKQPDILANEHCRTCDIDICYICSNKHMEHECRVSVDSKIKPSESETIELFNIGCKTLLNW